VVQVVPNTVAGQYEAEHVLIPVDEATKFAQNPALHIKQTPKVPGYVVVPSAQ